MKENSESKNVVPTVFSDITTANGLKLYLDDDTARLKSSPSLYHYTSISNVVAMIRSGTWHLGNAHNMNDNLEYNNGDPDQWKNLFFSCFMCEDKESIGMWSMYAQPWERGVKIEIPRADVRKWITSTTELREISIVDYQPTGRVIPLDGDSASLWLSSVAYCNVDSLQGKKDEERVTWSTAKNTKIKNAAHLPALTGYIKDMAWSYEKEIRIKAHFDNKDGIQRVAIPLTTEIINAMTITASPLFEGNLSEILEKEIASSIKTDTSIFTHRLNIKTICQSCELKQKNRAI